jgi:hypothetical protein
MGICFVGKVGIKDFLKSFINVKPGEILNQNGEVVGIHEGAELYTIGQRHGLDIGEEIPYYVCGKNIKLNQVFVTNDISDTKLWAKNLTLTSLSWINTPPELNQQYFLRYRHRGKLIPCTLKFNEPGQLDATLEEKATKYIAWAICSYLYRRWRMSWAEESSVKQNNIWQKSAKLKVLAPMDDVTDVAFRRMVFELGAPDIFFTEFVNVDGLNSRGRDNLLHKLLLFEGEDVIAQIWGTKPENYYKTT